MFSIHEGVYCAMYTTYKIRSAIPNWPTVTHQLLVFFIHLFLFSPAENMCVYRFSVEYSV